MSSKKLIPLAIVVVLSVTSGLAIATLFSVFNRSYTPPRATNTLKPLIEHAHLPATTPVVFDVHAYYRTIIDNNLFRPLGWRPPRPQEPYRLIGTILSTDGKTDAQAIFQTTHGNKTYTLTIGDTLDTDTTITDIQAKQVTLEKAGQQRTLRLNTTPWLK